MINNPTPDFCAESVKYNFSVLLRKVLHAGEFASTLVSDDFQFMVQPDMFAGLSYTDKETCVNKQTNFELIYCYLHLVH